MPYESNDNQYYYFTLPCLQWIFNSLLSKIVTLLVDQLLDLFFVDVFEIWSKKNSTRPDKFTITWIGFLQYLDKTLEPLNWIRVRDEHSCERSHVLYDVLSKISKYTTFKPHIRPSFRVFIPSNGSHLSNNKGPLT
jgi:hypothetical protein